ncbi:MAG: DUF3253 domain-containing protein [Verrucomicrobiota bacterium]
MKTLAEEQLRIRETIAALLQSRTVGGSICPSEVARALYEPDVWRDQMTLIREVAAAMVVSGDLEITQKGVKVDSATARGPIRLRKPNSVMPDQ